jgi:hypothetical protein
MLEDALDRACRGEIIAAAIVFARPNEDRCFGVSAPPRVGRRYLATACDYLKRDVIAETDGPGTTASSSFFGLARWKSARCRR